MVEFPQTLEVESPSKPKLQKH
ncbi:hypothetical protein LINPERPRIM_LOCUS627 [Linum perenne]